MPIPLASKAHLAAAILKQMVRLCAHQAMILYLCGSFSVQTTSRDYKANTTEVRATAVNFASPAKEKRHVSWENTTLFGIAKKIASANTLSLKTSGSDQNIASVS